MCRCEQKEEGEDCAPQKAIAAITDTSGSEPPPSSGKRVCLRCSQCKETFSGAWDLMFHAQNAHCINIYTLGEKDKVKPLVLQKKEMAPYTLESGYCREINALVRSMST